MNDTAPDFRDRIDKGLKPRAELSEEEKNALAEFETIPVFTEGGGGAEPAEAARASAVAGFGMLLKGSEFAGTSSREDVLALAEDAMKLYRDDFRAEFCKLAEKYLR